MSSMLIATRFSDAQNRRTSTVYLLYIFVEFTDTRNGRHSDLSINIFSTFPVTQWHYGKDSSITAARP